MIVQLNARIEDKLHKDAKIFCLQRGIKLEEMVSLSIAEYMKNAQKADKTKGSKTKLID